MKRYMFLLVSLPILFSSCEKDRITGDYDRFEGKFQWVYSSYVYRDCTLCPLKHHTDSAGEASYTAQIEFTNTGRVIFFIDNNVLIDKRFKVSDQYEENSVLYMDLWVDVNKNVLDINDRLEVFSPSVDTIYISGFPGNGYDEEFQGHNYFVRVK